MTEETLFELAVNTPESERAALLDLHCADNPELRARVEALLQADGYTLGFVPAATGIYEPASAPDPSAQETVGEAGQVVAGRYTLMEVIGEGGMGSVYLASQTEPVKRQVAVKLIRVERGQSKTILARFEAERQAIALMDHPHIAKLLDAGTTDTGQPYFIMELVKGIPLNDYCDQQRLTIAERLHLFTQICGALQHAHQKGIIHRDLKPSNVLLESHDGRAVPKVIDFGLAKATTGLQLTEQSLFTAFGSVMGTPLYMSPEQAAFNAVDVDTRADVYALGVILYELLTGTTPLTRENIKKAALDEMLKLVREQEAPTPSSRLSTSESAPSVAANRQIEPTKLGRLVRGELDSIVLKALSKERERRYETANGFARDIERFLNHEPVSAGPVSAAYQVKKFVRRNRGRVVAAGLVFAVLVAGLIGTGLGFLKAGRERDRALLAEVESKEQAAIALSARAEEQRQRLVAENNEQKAVSVVNEYFTIVSENRLLAIPGLQPLRRELLEAAVKYHAETYADAKDDPKSLTNLALSELRLAEVCHAVDDNEEALIVMDRASERIEKLLETHPQSKQDHLRLSGFWKGWRRNYHWTQLPKDTNDALRKLKRLTSVLERLSTLYPDSPGFQRDSAAIQFHIGELFALGSNRPKALESFYVCEAILSKLMKEHPSDKETVADLARTRLHIGFSTTPAKFAEGLEAAQSGFALMEGLVKEFPDSTRHRADLAWGHVVLGDLYCQTQKSEAERYSRTALKLLQELEKDNPIAHIYREGMCLAISSLRRCRAYKKDPVAEEQDIRSFLLIVQRTIAAGKNVQWERESSAHLQHLLGISLLNQTGRTDEAEQAYRSSMEQFQSLAQDYPTFSWYTEMIYHNHRWLAFLYEWKGSKEQYQSSLRAAIEVLKPKMGRKNATRPADWDTRMTETKILLAHSLLQSDKFEEAEPLLREALAIREKTQPDVWNTFNTQAMLGTALLGQKKYTEAEPLLVKGYEGMKAREKLIPPEGSTRIPEALDRLIELYNAMDKPDEVKKYRELRAKYTTPPELAPPPREKK